MSWSPPRRHTQVTIVDPPRSTSPSSRRSPPTPPRYPATPALQDTPFYFFGQHNVCRHLFLNCFSRLFWRKPESPPVASSNNEIHLKMNNKQGASSSSKRSSSNEPSTSKGSDKKHKTKSPTPPIPPTSEQQQQTSPPRSPPIHLQPVRTDNNKGPSSSSNKNGQQVESPPKRPGARINIRGPIDIPRYPSSSTTSGGSGGGSTSFLETAVASLPTRNPVTAAALLASYTMGNQGIRQHVETSTKTGVFHLSKAKLHEFPPELAKIVNALRSIDLSDNKISLIPQNISAFVNLKHLNLSHNQIEVIPDQIGQLAKLETLSLASNRIRSVPSTIAHLQKLRDANLNSNQLTAFPTVFSSLKFLTSLDLGRNQIPEVPDGVGDLQVVELILNQNQVRSVSKDLARCPNLKTLRLQENTLELGGFPKELLGESPVSLLNVEGNLFDVKQLSDLEGWDKYMERYTNTKKKLT